MFTSSFDDGIIVCGFRAMPALRILVSISAIGSLTVISVRHSTQRTLDLPTRLRHAGQFPIVRKFAETDPAHPKLSDVRPWSPTDAAPIVVANCKLRGSLRLRDLRLLRHSPSRTSGCLERHTEQRKQPAAFLIILSRCYDCDLHTACLIDAVVIDLRKNDLLVQPERVIATTIE
jgi:hypothetical protein